MYIETLDAVYDYMESLSNLDVINIIRCGHVKNRALQNVLNNWWLQKNFFNKMRRRYATIEEIKTASKEELNKITKNNFLKCFEDWKKRWHKCIISDGDYFEGDKIDIHE
ncbi:hypothetical protein ALC56_15334 [Trachymyrmex septentrionalis]|uniref:Uncharacterized protein n=1 Tax=Trachymyrmex septentrionalis TaxID=34720 RepID=A0A151JSJ4_9HYME|nr:hypothetical protein ALC56_15334 [Trachymyrmex septentrionalis]